MQVTRKFHSISANPSGIERSNGGYRLGILGMIEMNKFEAPYMIFQDTPSMKLDSSYDWVYVPNLSRKVYAFAWDHILVRKIYFMDYASMIT